MMSRLTSSEEGLEEHRKQYADYWKRQKRKAYWWAIRQRCAFHDDYYLSFIEKIFYTIKALICMFLGREKRFKYNDEYVDGVASWNHNSYATQEGTFYEWIELTVGYGVFRNWYYEIYSDGT